MLCCIKYYELRFQNNSASATLSLSPIVQLDVKDMSLNGWIFHNPCWGSHGHQDILHRNHHSLWGSLKTLEISSNFQDSGALGWAKDGERSWKVRDINKPMISQGYPKDIPSTFTIFHLFHLFPCWTQRLNAKEKPINKNAPWCG